MISPMRVDRMRTNMGEYVLSIRTLRDSDDSPLELDVRAGDLVRIDGADASLVLARIAAVGRRYRASIRFAGYEIASWPQTRIVQAGCVRVTALHPGFLMQSVLEIVLAGAFVRRRDPRVALRVAREELERCGLAGRADARAESLDPVERIRVSLARALATQPRLVLVDAAASVLDDGALRAAVGAGPTIVRA